MGECGCIVGADDRFFLRSSIEEESALRYVDGRAGSNEDELLGVLEASGGFRLLLFFFFFIVNRTEENA